MLKVEHISKSFGEHRVLHDLSFEVGRGEIVGLTGNNGSGKTTLMRIINMLLPADEGEVLFDGQRMTLADLNKVGYMPEERGLFRHSSVEEQLVYLAMLKGMSRKEAKEELKIWLQRLDIEHWIKMKPARMSKGMQQKVQFVATVLHRPLLLVLDEPFSGFDTPNAELLEQQLLRLKELGTAVLLSTHNHAAARRLCKNIITL